jgi:hypothetical protein
MLARACGSPDRWLDHLVRHRAQAANLHFDLGSFAAFRLPFSIGLGFPREPGGVFAAGLPSGLLCRKALCGLVGPCEQLV